MNLEHIERNFNNLELEYGITNGVSSEELKLHEFRLGVIFPEQVKFFYQAINGITVVNPPFEVLDVQNLYRDGSYIVFCKINEMHRLCFDVSCLNEAEQWDIINYETGYRVTKTIASFWANKMMAWLRKKSEIWAVEKY